MVHIQNPRVDGKMITVPLTVQGFTTNDFNFFRDFVRVQSERDMGTQYEEHFIHAIEVKTEFLSHLDEEEQYYFKDKEKLLVSEGILYDLHLS